MAHVAKVKDVNRRWRLVALLVGLLLAPALLPSDAGAQSSSASTSQSSSSKKKRQNEISQRISRLKDEVKEASAEEAELLGRLDEVENRRRAADAKVATLDRQVAAAERELAIANATLEELTAQLAQSHAQLEVTRASLDEARRELHAQAINAYMGQPSARVSQLAYSLGNQREVAAAKGYMDALIRASAGVVDRYRTAKQELESVEATVKAKREGAKAQQSLIADKVEVVEHTRTIQDRARDEVVAEERKAEALVNEVRSRKNEFQAQISALQAESNSIAVFLRSVQGGQATTISGKGLFMSPIPGARITSSFGPRVHPIFGDSRMHNGIDFGAASGTAIRAAGAGTVVSSGPRGGYGNVIILDHGNSLATLYAHQSALLVGVGARVAKGQVIGRVGSTGYSTGPHLHFEVRRNGVPVDPLGYM